MHVQILASGSQGNCALVRSGATHVLLDAGLPLPELEARLDQARVPLARIDHIALTHGHLDHSRSAGALAKKAGARVHCALRLMRNASVRSAETLATLPVGGETELAGPGGRDAIRLRTVPIPHDAVPTVAFRLEAGGRVCVLITDMGHSEPDAAKQLYGAHLLILEFNHDAERLRTGPYDRKLKRRVAGPQGHLSNDEAADMLRRLAGPELHTVVLAHLSATNNTRQLAVQAARTALSDIGRDDVEVHVADQDAIGPNLEV